MLQLVSGGAMMPVLASLSLIQSEPVEPLREPLHAPIDYAAIDAEIDANIAALGIAEALPVDAARRESYDRLIFPVRPRSNADVYRGHFIGNYVDQDQTGPNALTDWACGQRTYDLVTGYDHAGTDISTVPFRAHAMNQRWVEVVAAAPGVIVARSDGAADRNCGGINSDRAANYVTIRQDDGLTAYYWHLARDTVTERQIGERVEVGEYLGLVGSSGLSTAPHLHFELRNQNGTAVDPYAGACSADRSLWRHQHDYADPAITAIHTHNFTPENVIGSFCQPEYPRFRTEFSPGDRVYLGLYVRDRAIGAMSSLSVRNPSGETVFTQAFPDATAFAAAADYQTSYLLPDDAPGGQWVIRAEFQSDVRESAFYVGGGPSAGARLAAAVLPGSRSVQSGMTAAVFATVLNPSEVVAQGCWISPASPFSGRFEYRETDPGSNAVTGDPNALFDIAAGGARSFVLSFTPHAGNEADSYELMLRFKCDNSDSTAYFPGVNTVLLSFGAEVTPDLVAVALTPSQDGILQLADAASANAFAVAVSNVGASGALTVRPSGQRAAGSLRLRVCETDPATGACLAPPDESVTRTFAADETASFAVFARGEGTSVPFAPASNRIQLIAEDADGTIRGATSVAVRTQ
jgi:hypothetical protein